MKNTVSHLPIASSLKEGKTTDLCALPFSSKLVPRASCETLRALSLTLTLSLSLSLRPLEALNRSAQVGTVVAGALIKLAKVKRLEKK